MSKKVVACILAVVMLMGLFSLAATANRQIEKEDFHKVMNKAFSRGNTTEFVLENLEKRNVPIEKHQISLPSHPGKFVEGKLDPGEKDWWEVKAPKGQLFVGILWNNFSNNLDLYAWSASGRCSSNQTTSLTEECDFRHGGGLLHVIVVYYVGSGTQTQSYYGAGDVG